MIIGQKIGLRALEQADLALMQEWRNRENYRKYFREYRELSLQHQLNWFNSTVIQDNRTLMFAIVELISGDLIGVCGLCYINWIHRHSDLSIYIGKDNIYIDTNSDGYTWDTVDVLLEYGFNQLNLHKVWTEIYEFDICKHTFLESYGFHRDGVFRDNYFYDGKYMDSHIFSLLSDDWRSIHGRT